MRYKLPAVLSLCLAVSALDTGCGPSGKGTEVQLTSDPTGHLLHNAQCFSPDDAWIVYDNRPAGDRIAGTGTIEKVNVRTGEIVRMYQTPNQTEHGPGVGAVTYSPTAERILFIHGLFNCNASRPYSVIRRVGVAVDDAARGVPIHVDARDVTPPFTPGALRGGTHAHTFSGDGAWISFTYQDAVLAELEERTGKENLDLRTVGVSAPVGPVQVDKDPQGENNDGEMFSVLVARVVPHATPGSDEIEKAFSDSWVGRDGYVRADATRQKRAIAFQGHVRDDSGNKISEVFIVDVPDRIDVPGPAGPLEGTPTTRPMPPKATRQRRLTYTADRKHPGIQGPRHWLKSSPDGSRIAYLAKDDDGIVQLLTVSPLGGKPTQVTRNPWPIQTPLNWSPDGHFIAYGMDNSIFITDVRNGRSTRMTQRSSDELRPQPTGVVWSNDGKTIAFNRLVPHGDGRGNARKSYLQIFLLKL